MTRDRRVRPGGELVAARRASASTSRKPNAVEPLLGGRHRQRADAGERVEQRREEQLLVDRPHDCLVALVLGVELRRAPAASGSVAEPEHAREVRARVGVGREACGSGARRRAAAGARRCAATRTPSSSCAASAIVDVAAGRELLERVERARATGSTDRGGRARAAAAAPRTRCRGCRRSPRFSSRSDRPLLAQHLLRCAPSSRATSRTASGSSTSGHTNGSARADERARRARRRRRPGRALMSACSSHVCAHRSQYASYASSVRLSAPDAAFGPQVGVGAEHDAVGGRLGHRRAARARAARSASRLIAFVHEQHVDVARVVQLVRRRACPCR